MVGVRLTLGVAVGATGTALPHEPSDSPASSNTTFTQRTVPTFP